MRGRLIISRFAALCGLSPKTLRYYDEIGLLRPERVDDASGYRFYGVAQLGVAARIARWREVGLPLAEVRALLDAPGREAEVLARHARRLRREIEDRERSLARLHAHSQEAPMDYRLEHLPARRTLAIRARLRPPGYGVIPEALGELVAHARARGLAPARPAFFVHHNDDEGAGEGSRLDVHLPVEGEPEPGGRVEVVTFAGGPAFVGRFVGPYDRTGAAYTAVAEEALRRGLALSGVTVELYVKSVPDTPDPEMYETDIAFLLDEG